MEVGERDAVKDKETSFALLNHNCEALSFELFTVAEHITCMCVCVLCGSVDRC